jgi:hypothetical protein
MFVALSTAYRDEETGSSYINCHIRTIKTDDLVPEFCNDPCLPPPPKPKKTRPNQKKRKEKGDKPKKAQDPASCSRCGRHGHNKRNKRECPAWRPY